MAKTAQGQNTPEENKRRLQEIAETRFGALSDDEILRFLAERTQLSDLEREYEKMQKEEKLRLEEERRKEESLKTAEKKKIIILEKIKELNKSISGEVSDDDLLILVSHRRELEKELEALSGGSAPQKEEVSPRLGSHLRTEGNTLPEKELPKTETPDSVREEETSGNGGERASTGTFPEKLTAHVEEGYGSEKILSNGIEEDSKFHRYLDQLKNNVGSLGTLLQDMPLDAKKNKAFMLKVAEIDPAYAMHFADKDTLKKDESFNIQVASFQNPRNSGNALAEMLPEARTSKVLLVAVKQDYRNVRFVQPHMADYEEMLRIAKTGALEKVRSLKEAADVRLLIPKPLQQDKQFMLQVKEITEPKKKE